MCSIIGYCGPVADPKAFTEGFAQTVSRGPDDTRIVDTGNGVLGFHRLAIMDLTSGGMQPFELDGSYVVCNGYSFGENKMAFQNLNVNSCRFVFCHAEEKPQEIGAERLQLSLGKLQSGYFISEIQRFGTTVSRKIVCRFIGRGVWK